MLWGGAAHPIDYVSSSPVFTEGLNGPKVKYASLPSINTPKTIIENDVWLGTGVYIKAGITIHSGAVIGMNSVVTHDVGAYEIWAGNPATKIMDRFDETIKQRLLKSEWWNKDDSLIRELAQYFGDPDVFLEKLEKIEVE